MNEYQYDILAYVILSVIYILGVVPTIGASNSFTYLEAMRVGLAIHFGLAALGFIFVAVAWAAVRVV